MRGRKQPLCYYVRNCSLFMHLYGIGSEICAILFVVLHTLDPDRERTYEVYVSYQRGLVWKACRVRIDQ